MHQDTVFSTTVGRHVLTIATGKLAEQAGGAVTLQVGESMLLATATMSKSIREGLDFFPLSVDFEEKMYAAGRIPGGFFRREGKPTTEAVLTSRLTDRPLRPLFPDGMRNEVQVIVTTLSSDSVYHLDIMSVNAASAALTISDVPWNGPIGAVRIGYINGEFVIDPTIPEMADSTLDLRIAGTRDAIIMVEAAADEIPEDLIVEALAFGHQALQPIITLLEEMRAAVGKEKREPTISEVDPAIVEATRNRIDSRIAQVIANTTEREDRNEALDALREEIVDGFMAEDEALDPKDVREVFSDEIKKAVRHRILYDGIRPDGRDYTTIRPLSSEVGISPRAHGSGLFQRGQTQVLSIVALGTPREAQKLDGLSPEDSRRYMHHYNFPPFSTGETWPMRGPRRREIGHGALAENALLPMIPSEEEFPYTIRVVSEVLSSNGSTSQASVCASSLALMDAGVPIKRPVGGVAMGLVTDGNKYAVLTDIQGMEDHLGDMDFKVAGSSEGITALQMDIKISGLNMDIMKEALEQARVGRMEILDSMLQTISAPRQELSRYAPRMLTIKIDPEKIGAVIGKGGATIRGLEEEFEVSVDIQEDGTVFVAGVDGLKAEAALDRIHMLTHDPDLGEIFTGKVVRLTDFGVFVELAPGQDGMVHISQLASEHLQRVEDAVQMGDEIMVMVTDVSSEGKIRLSRRAVLEGWTLEEARAQDAVRKGGGGPRGGNGDRRGGGGDRRGGGDRGGRPPRR
ncbi:MAG: polyribonucleotide nucleotidyltransferase [Anaerolineae bacterium]|nr:polyribonucleotide nucleotidyltransferase [Promineifilum sp.]MCZ2114247.1 polyribonucleotide nucleotidyltransferase [Anaerolineae bacterium]